MACARIRSSHHLPLSSKLTHFIINFRETEKLFDESESKTSDGLVKAKPRDASEAKPSYLSRF